MKLGKNEVLAISPELRRVITHPLVKVNALEACIGTNISPYKDLIELYGTKKDLINDKIDEETREDAIAISGVQQVTMDYLKTLDPEQLKHITIIDGIVVPNA